MLASFAMENRALDSVTSGRFPPKFPVCTQAMVDAAETVAMATRTITKTVLSSIVD
jgi:hypothetical protein